MKEREIWLVNLEGTGHEQVGERPVLIINYKVKNIVVVIPLTSNIYALRFPYTIEIKPSNKNNLKRNSIALIFQIRAIDKRRLKRKIGELEEQLFKKIKKEIKNFLDL